MPVLYDSRTETSNTGARILQEALGNKLSEEYLAKSIIGRDIETLSAFNGKRIYWTHNNPWDEKENRAPQEVYEEYHLLPGTRWDKIDDIVFTSKWQRQKYIEAYNFGLDDLPKLHIIPNGINPIPEASISKSTDGQVRLIYASPPDRGLMLLYAAFTRLIADNPNIVLDVYSSWEQLGISTNADFVSHDILKKCEENPNINWHGYQPHSVVLDAMAKADIFAYPCMFPEVTSMPLVEAMSAKCICVHPNGAGLTETAQQATFSYEINKFHKDHVDLFVKQTQIAIDAVNDNNTGFFNLEKQKSLVDAKHAWNVVIPKWEAVIDG
jgi:glycosyltransferase involved in cell wall biosynthesis